MDQVMSVKENKLSGFGDEAGKYEIIQECLKGNPDRFGILVTQHKKLIFSIVYKYFNNLEETEDIAQEAFIKIYKSLHQYNPQYSFTGWAAKITQNLCLDILRKKKVSYTALGDVEEYLSSSSTPESEYIQNEDRCILYNAIKMLPEKYRSIFEMYHEDGISYKEMADILQLPLSSIKNRLSRARIMVRENITAARGNLGSC